MDSLAAVAAPPTPIPLPTATPEPTAVADPFAPGEFDGVALRDAMVDTRWTIEQMGGLLDRLYNGSIESCDEYRSYTFTLLISPTFEGVPPAWQGVYNDYIFAIANVLNTNNGVTSLCSSGGGFLNDQAYGNARQGINTSLERIGPAIDVANGLVGQ